jgi:hypothetical protein
MPPMEVTNETRKATIGGKKTHVFTPETENCMYRASMVPLFLVVK